MSKFYVGQKVTVTENHPESAQVEIGDIVEITEFIEVDSVGENYTVEGVWRIHGKYLSPITETPETLTVNGVEYIRKPEPEHEWKFGDVAVHKVYGVGIVFGVENEDTIVFKEKATLSMRCVSPRNLTFIRRTDFSV